MRNTSSVIVLVAALGACSTAPAPHASPSESTPSDRFSGVTVGYGHACAWTAAGALYCWGSNSAGQLGTGSLEHERCELVDSAEPCSRTPLRVAVQEPVSRAIASTAHTCAQLHSGAIACWGADSRGELGTPKPQGPARFNEATAQCPNVQECSPTPRTGPALSNAFTAWHANDATTCVAYDGDHGAECWGEATWSFDRDLSQGEPPVLGAREPLLTSEGVRSVAAGLNPCVVTRTGRVLCSPMGMMGSHLGGPGEPRPLAHEVQGLQGPAVQVDAGLSHTCARTEAGHVQCWGSNAVGELGDPGPHETDPIRGLDMSTAAAAPVPLGAPAINLAVGAMHACAIVEDGRVACWGRNGRGQLGAPITDHTCTVGSLPPEPCERAPVWVSLPEGERATSLSAGDDTTCAVTSTGRLWCWGENVTAQLARDDAGASSPDRPGTFSAAPVEIALPPSP